MDACNYTWATSYKVTAATRAELAYLLAEEAVQARPTPTFPQAYAQQVQEVLSYLPQLLHHALQRIILETDLPGDFLTVHSLSAVLRECIGKKLLGHWDVFIASCVANMPVRRTLFRMPWVDPDDLTALRTQMGLAQEAAAAVADAVSRTWDAFVARLLQEPGTPLLWVPSKTLTDVLADASTLPFEHMNTGRYLLALLLSGMKDSPEDDNFAAMESARLLNTKLKATFAQPYPSSEGDYTLMTPTWVVYKHMEEMLQCNGVELASLMRTHRLVDSSKQEVNVVGVANRILPLLYNVHLPSTRPVAPFKHVQSAMRVRKYMHKAFELSVSSAHGVPVAALLETNRDLTSSPPMHAVKSVVNRALLVLFMRYPQFHQRWASQLAAAVAFISLGNEAWPWTPAPDRAMSTLAQRMVVKVPDSTGASTAYITLLPLIEYIGALPIRHGAIPKVKGQVTQGLVSCPCGPRNPVEVALKFLAPAPLHWLKKMPRPHRQIALDGMSTKMPMFEDGPWATAVSYRQGTNAVREFHVECAYGMPNMHLLATRLSYFETQDLGSESAARLPEDVPVCALLWHMSAGVRHDKVLSAVHTPSSPTDKKRKRKESEEPECQACGACFQPADMAPFLGVHQPSCEHPLCLPCAVRLVETRTADVAVGDGSSEELTHGQLLKCPYPGCEQTVEWALPCAGPQAKFVAGKVMAASSRVSKMTSGPGRVACAVCWDVCEVDVTAGVVGTCRTCQHDTCAQCGRLSHPGSLCSLRLNGTPFAPETILSEAKMQACPHEGCAVQTTKDGGCNHITCTKCGQHWCWVCALPMALDSVTDHYKTGSCSSHAYSEQFEMDRIRARVQARADVGEGLKLDVLRLLSGAFTQSATDL